MMECSIRNMYLLRVRKNICCVLAQDLLPFHRIYKHSGMCSVKSEWRRLILVSDIVNLECAS